MSDSMFHFAASEETTAEADAPPEFGLVDVIEAFTAMRHEWRGQTKESRALAEAVQAAVTNIQELEAKLLAQTAAGSADESRRLVELIVDTDNHLTRALDATTQSEANRRLRDAADAQAMRQYFNGMHGIARWFARPLLTFVEEQHQAKTQTAEHPAVAGLNLVLATLRRMMKEHQIIRIDTLGQVFDAELMNAVGTVAAQDCPSGHVAEQLSPGYRWRGRLLRFADVRVAS